MAKKILTKVLVLFLMAGFAQAGVIQLLTKIITPVNLVDGINIINVSVENTGDDIAKDLYVEAITPEGFTSNNIQLGDVAAGTEASGILQINVPSNKEGRYPLILKIKYSDANAYPFSVIASTYLNVKKYTPTNIYGTTEKLEVSENGENSLSVKITNRGETERKVTATAYLPDEFRVDNKVRELILKPKVQENLVYDIGDLGGQAGSAYLGIISLEYDDASHNTVLVPVAVEVTKQSSNKLYIWGIAAALGVIVVTVLFKVLSRKKEKKTPKKK
ncbi:MAG: hypothetical protein KKD39_05225 [Candidatus Altiarchaeota archaeon]|nr:hypothetical protein [Candidatus Altiarchaeota archaeon]